jgi:xylulose-5-phosphate/fructose-6-phosphate phosphoketolase
MPTVCYRWRTTALAAATRQRGGASKRALPQWFAIEEAVVLCTEGNGIWKWARSDHSVAYGADQSSESDVALACCGDTPAVEVLAATFILRKHRPELKVRVINVVDLMKLQSASERQHSLDEANFDSLFTKVSTSSLAFTAARCRCIASPNVAPIATCTSIATWRKAR